jgi:hypothetical protein
MENNDDNKRSLQSIARDYFDYLGRHLPQQCASDEFYFLPRSGAAIPHLNTLDDLTPERIQDHLQYVRTLLREIPSEASDDLEEDIDRLLVRQSMKSFMREFADAKVWRTDPTLYIKIPLFATSRILSQTDTAPDRIKAELLTLFTQIPSFLNGAVKNLSSPSEISLKVAFDMARDALQFYEHDISSFVLENVGGDEELLEKNREVLEAWERYKKDLLRLTYNNSFAIGEDGLREMLTISLSYPKSPREILETAQHAYHETLEQLGKLAGKIDDRKSWEDLVYEQRPSITSSSEFMKLYENQVQDLRRFFHTQDIISFPPDECVSVLQTPSYLQSLRATASYSAPLTGNTKGQGIFYLTPGKEDLELISTHCPYLSAHETYPGHHILDHLRIHHSNPIRRQIESPLFYEGWACYGEQLLDELGYVQNPRQQLIGLKRQLWRDLRAELDVKLQTGKITLDKAAKEIEILGFSHQRAQRQVRRFALTPGYQLCYFMGNHEISRLRKQFSSQLGIKRFHDSLLGGGQLPFHLVERRLQAS